MQLCAEGPGRGQPDIADRLLPMLRRHIISSFWISLKVPLKKGSEMFEQREQEGCEHTPAVLISFAAVKASADVLKSCRMVGRKP